jgi:LysM repeat protein
MRHRTPGRWLAPVALVAAAVAVYAVATGNKSDDGSTSTSGDRQTTTRQATTTTAKPAASRRKTYVVKPGDVLSAIAVKTGLTVEELLALNPGVDAQTLQPGDRLKLR